MDLGIGGAYLAFAMRPKIGRSIIITREAPTNSYVDVVIPHSTM